VNVGNRRVVRLFCVTLAAVAAATVCVPLFGTARAAEIDDKRAQAAALDAQITDNGRRLDALNEQIHTAENALVVANAAIADADAQVAAAQARTAAIQSVLATRAVEIYTHGARRGIAGLDTKDAQDLTTRQKYTDLAGQRDKQLLAQLVRSREQLADRKAEAESARAAAQAQKTQITSTRDELQAGDTKQRALLKQVTSQIADLVAQAEAERQAREAAEAAARLRIPPAQPAAAVAPAVVVATATQPNTASAPAAAPVIAPRTVASPAPPSSGRVGAVLAYAYAQLGKPYCYAGAGPGCYDCSGLTMMAWAQAGVSMTHGSDDQLASFPRVPMSQLQPGDLVFWDGHVGIYVGNSSVLHAPHTGTVVQIEPIWPGVIGAVRPG
jgi:cell wall-associated NlpC family hydrolase